MPLGVPREGHSGISNRRASTALQAAPAKSEARARFRSAISAGALAAPRAGVRLPFCGCGGSCLAAFWGPVSTGANGEYHLCTPTWSPGVPAAGSREGSAQYLCRLPPLIAVSREARRSLISTSGCSSTFDLRMCLTCLLARPRGVPSSRGTPRRVLAGRTLHSLSVQPALPQALGSLFPYPGRPLPRPRPAPSTPTSPGRLRPATGPHPALGSDPSVPCSACFLDHASCFASACTA